MLKKSVTLLVTDRKLQALVLDDKKNANVKNEQHRKKNEQNSYKINNMVLQMNDIVLLDEN